MTIVSKFTTPTAAATEVDARARRYISEHQGSTYQEAMSVVLKSDKALAESYAQPASRRARMATPTDARSKHAVPIAPAEEAEITAWITRAITDGKAGSLPGALGQLSIEADKFARIGVPIAEAVRRAMGLFPHLVSMSKVLLQDVRRNAPENTPDPELAQGKPDYVLHLRATQLMQSTELSYREAVASVLDNDQELKTAYARS